MKIYCESRQVVKLAMGQLAPRAVNTAGSNYERTEDLKPYDPRNICLVCPISQPGSFNESKKASWCCHGLASALSREGKNSKLSRRRLAAKRRESDKIVENSLDLAKPGLKSAEALISRSSRCHGWKHCQQAGSFVWSLRVWTLIRTLPKQLVPIMKG